MFGTMEIPVHNCCSRCRRLLLPYDKSTLAANPQQLDYEMVCQQDDGIQI
jgi:hypothetical protein